MYSMSISCLEGALLRVAQLQLPGSLLHPLGLREEPHHGALAVRLGLRRRRGAHLPGDVT